MANTWIKSTQVYCLKTVSCNQIQILLCCLQLPLTTKCLIVLMNTGQYLTVHCRWARTLLEQLWAGAASTWQCCHRTQTDGNEKCPQIQRKPVSSVVFLWQMIHDCLWEDWVSHYGKRSKKSYGAGQMVRVPWVQFFLSLLSPFFLSLSLWTHLQGIQGEPRFSQQKKCHICWGEASHPYPLRGMKVTPFIEPSQGLLFHLAFVPNLVLSVPQMGQVKDTKC